MEQCHRVMVARSGRVMGQFCTFLLSGICATHTLELVAETILYQTNWVGSPDQRPLGWVMGQKFGMVQCLLCVAVSLAVEIFKMKFRHSVV